MQFLIAQINLENKVEESKGVEVRWQLKSLSKRWLGTSRLRKRLNNSQILPWVTARSSGSSSLRKIKNLLSLLKRKNRSSCALHTQWGLWCSPLLQADSKKEIRAREWTKTFKIVTYSNNNNQISTSLRSLKGKRAQIHLDKVWLPRESQALGLDLAPVEIRLKHWW